MVRLKKLKISSDDIANINYTILLNTKHGSASFEELWDLPIFQSMVAYPFNNVQKTKKMGLVRRKVSNLLQLEDSDFPPKGERASVFSEPVWDEYMKRFIKKIGEQEVMYIVNALVQADYLQMKKPTEKNPYVDKEYQFLSINARNRLTEDNTTLENLESNLGKILGYEYEQGTQETEKEKEFRESTDIEEFIPFINSQGKKDERKNPEWDKAFDELADEKFKEWRLERQEEEEEDLEQYDEDDEYETAEKMLKAIEIAKAVFKPTQQKTIKHILKIMPKSDFKRHSTIFMSV